MSLTSKRHLSESPRNGKTTREKGGRNPPDVTLEYLVEDLLLFFNMSRCLHAANNAIKKKYAIERENGNLWPEDDIKRAWGKATRMEMKPSKRKHWARVIMIQVIKRWLYERKEKVERENERGEAENVDLLTDVHQACGTEESMTGETRERSNKPNRAEKKMMTKGKQKQAPKPNSGPAASTHKPTSQTQPSTPKNREQHGNTPKNRPPISIRIPLSVVSDDEPEKYKSTSFENCSNAYTLIDRVPTRTEIRKRKSYIMSYNSETKNAVWVYEILNRETLKDSCEEHMRFGMNEIEDKDYNQGHLAAAANHRWCQEAYHDTFLMSNMAPQEKSLNKRSWSELEKYCRDIVMKDQVRNVHVYTGPLYLGKKLVLFTLNNSSRAVPTHFFKVVIVEKTDGTVEEPECYVMPKEKNTIPQTQQTQTIIELLDKFKMSIADFENLSKINFRDISSCNSSNIPVKWTGEDKSGKSLSVDFVVRSKQGF